MTDLGENDGGETVFPEGWPPFVAEEDRPDPRKVSPFDFRAAGGSKHIA